MNKLIKNPLKKIGIYDYVKFSRLFKPYISLFNPAAKQAFDKEVKLYKSFLGKCDLIFDIGASEGAKAAIFLQLSERIICVEPSPANVKTLRIRFRGQRSRVAVEGVAMAASEGRKELFMQRDGYAFNTLNEKFKTLTESDPLDKWEFKINYNEKVVVPTKTLDSLIAKYGRPDFIKIDVEGYELEVIKGLSSPVPCLSMECLIPEFRSELNQSIELLSRLHPRIEFNISVKEQLVFDKFRPFAELPRFLDEFSETHFELVVKMDV